MLSIHSATIVWDKIEIIKKTLSENDYADREDLQELLCFKRKERKTAKEANEDYQKLVNQLF